MNDALLTTLLTVGGSTLLGILTFFGGRTQGLRSAEGGLIKALQESMRLYQESAHNSEQKAERLELRIGLMEEEHRKEIQELRDQMRHLSQQLVAYQSCPAPSCPVRVTLAAGAPQ